MTLEERLSDALHQVDQFDPSPDLFARVTRSIEEDRIHRRRLWKIGFSIFLGAALAVLYFTAVAADGPRGATVARWEAGLFEVAVMGALVLVLAPHITRFGQGYVAEVFHLSPETGDRFLKVLDVAYYLVFTGLVFLNVDFGDPTREIRVSVGLEHSAGAIAFLLGGMGLLHVINVVAMPVLGLVFNSVIRLALRREAGATAPPETLRGLTADRNARAVAIGIAVTVAALVAGFIMSGGIGLLLGES